LSRLFKAIVKENKQIIKDHYLLTLHPLEKIKEPKPGNFFMVSVDKGLDPLLKRPFSVHRRSGDNFQLLYRVVGKGTKILGGKQPGETCEVLGPLGNEFPLNRNHKNIVLVAGGIGVAPIFALVELITKACKTKNTTPDPPLVKGGNISPILFYGTRTEREILCIDEFKSIGIDPVISTDDGTFGNKGNIISVLKKYLTRNPLPATRNTLYACGPEPMLKSLSVLVKKFRLKGYAALEQNMACGLGTCLGCVVNTKNGYKRVCKEGPVFPIEDIVWE
jgi:dihydroorotate dehydrogenase electron transfer subunit